MIENTESLINEIEKIKILPFNFTITKEQVHRLIFKCCSYNTNEAKALWKLLEKNEDEKNYNPIENIEWYLLYKYIILFIF